MDKINLPETINKIKLDAAAKELYLKAVEENGGKEIKFCDGAKDIEGCYSGFIRQDGKLFLLFTWNIGKYSTSVKGIYDVS